MENEAAEDFGDLVVKIDFLKIGYNIKGLVCENELKAKFEQLPNLNPALILPLSDKAKCEE